MIGTVFKPRADTRWARWAGENRFVRLAVSMVNWLAGPELSFGSVVIALLKGAWILFWMRWAGRSGYGRFATRLATWFAPPYRARRRMALLFPCGYVAPGATLYHPGLRLGANVFIDDGVVIYRGDPTGGPVDLGDKSVVYRGSFLETGEGGSLSIGAGSSIFPGCQLKAYKAPIRIGCGVGISQNCALYPYDHGTQPGESIHRQPLQTKGGIVIEDDAWLGTGVIVLSGVRIGKGAVVGAGSVVWRDVPDGAVATGVPARVVKLRDTAGCPTGEDQ